MLLSLINFFFQSYSRIQCAYIVSLFIYRKCLQLSQKTENVGIINKIHTITISPE